MTNESKMYYQTSNLIDETGASEHSIRRYVRLLEENESYPSIERDNRQNRLFNELDRMALIEMVRLVKDEKKGVKDAADTVISRLDKYRGHIEDVKSSTVVEKETSETSSQSAYNERLEYAVELMERVIDNQNSLTNQLTEMNQRLNNIEDSKPLLMHKETREEEQTETIDNEDDKQADSLNGYRNTDILTDTKKPKKENNFFSKLKFW